MMNLKDVYKNPTMLNQFLEDHTDSMLTKLKISGVGCTYQGLKYLKRHLYKNKSGFKKKTFCYGDYQPDGIENFFGMVWDGVERDEWMKSVHKMLLQKVLERI